MEQLHTKIARILNDAMQNKSAEEDGLRIEVHISPKPVRLETDTYSFEGVIRVDMTDDDEDYMTSTDLGVLDDAYGEDAD